MGLRLPRKDEIWEYHTPAIISEYVIVEDAVVEGSYISWKLRAVGRSEHQPYMIDVDRFGDSFWRFKNRTPSELATAFLCAICNSPRDDEDDYLCEECRNG